MELKAIGAGEKQRNNTGQSLCSRTAYIRSTAGIGGSGWIEDPVTRGRVRGAGAGAGGGWVVDLGARALRTTVSLGCGAADGTTAGAATDVLPRRRDDVGFDDDEPPLVVRLVRALLSIRPDSLSRL